MIMGPRSEEAGLTLLGESPARSRGVTLCTEQAAVAKMLRHKHFPGGGLRAKRSAPQAVECSRARARVQSGDSASNAVSNAT